MQSLAKTLAMGGNYQLNVGPKPDGTLAAEDVASLQRIGAWYRRVRESFDGAEPCTYMLSDEGHLIDYDPVLLTRKGNTVYVQVHADLHTSGVMLHPFDRTPRSATLLNDGRPIRSVVDVTPWRWKGRPALRLIDLPVNEITDEPLVVKLEFGDALAE